MRYNRVGWNPKSGILVIIREGGGGMKRVGTIWQRFTGWLTAPRVAALVLGLLGVLIGYAGYKYRYCECTDWPNLASGWEQLFLDFYANVSASLVTITLTVLTIDWLNERRAEQEAMQQLKKQLIQDMASQVNQIAVRASEKLRARGWLEDGSLKGVSFGGAGLQGVDLRKADLRETDLHTANMREANLRSAKLEDALYTDEDLVKASSLKGAILSDYGVVSSTQPGTTAGKFTITVKVLFSGRYNGCYNLDGDLHVPREFHFANDPEKMAHWYGVPLENYLAGQEWARKNLSRVRREAGLEPPGEAADTEEPENAASLVLTTNWRGYTVRRLFEKFFPFGRG